MAGQVFEELQIKVTTDSKSAVKGLKATEKSVNSFKSSFKDVAKTIAGPLAAGAITAAVLKMGKEFSSLAADAEETKSKFQAVFKDQSSSVNRWADDYSSAFGRSSTDTLSFLSTIQDTLVPLGFARDKAADFSKEVVSLAGDLASFNNLPTADVVRDIQSAMVGNTETMRKYGVVASQAAIEQEALTSGLWDGIGAIDAQTKAQAILQITMKGTKDAQGDLARTQDSTANTMVRLSSQWKKFGENMGGTLNEVITPMASGLANLLTHINNLTDEMNKQSESNKKVNDAQKAVEDGSATLSQQLLVEQTALEDLRQTREDLYSDDPSSRALPTFDKEIKAQEEIVRAVKDKFMAEERANGMQKQGLETIAAQKKAEEAAAAIVELGNKNAVNWTKKREEAQKGLLKQIEDINAESKAGLIEGNGALEKESALRATLSKMIEDGFRVEGIGFQKVIAYADDYGISLGDVAAEMKKLAEQTEAKTKREEKAKAMQKEIFDTLENGYAKTIGGQKRAIEASIEFWETFGSGDEATEILDGLNKQLNELNFSSFQNSFAETIKDVKLFESTVLDIASVIKTAWGDTYDSQVADAQEAYDKIAGIQDEALQKVIDDEDAKIQKVKDNIMENDSVSDEEKEKIQELEDEKSAAVADASDENKSAVEAYYNNEINKAKEATDLIQGMELLKNNAVKEAELDKTKAMDDAETARIARIKKAEVEKFNAKKATDVAEIAIDTVAAAIEALPNWVNAGLVTAAGLAAGIKVAAQPAPSFALGTQPDGFIVPPGYENDSFSMNVSSGEKVNVSSRDDTNNISSTQPMALTMEIDGRAVGKVMFNLSKDRLLTIDEQAVVVV